MNMNNLSKRFYLLLLLPFLFLIANGCESGTPKSNNITINVIDESGKPIDNAAVKFNDNSFRTNLKGQVSFSKIDIPQNKNFNFEIYKDGYTPLSIKISKVYLGDGDKYVLEKIDIADFIIPVPTLLKPNDQEQSSNTKPTFEWSNINSANSYILQVDNNSDFSSPLIDISTTDTKFKSDNLARQNYYWRVKAKNSLNESRWSDARSFSISTLKLQSPRLLTPTNGFVTNEVSPNFDWSDVSRARSYELQVDDNSSFNSPNIKQNTSSSSFKVNQQLSVGTYYWRVRAKSSTANSSWSSSWKFDIEEYENQHFIDLSEQYKAAGNWQSAIQSYSRVRKDDLDLYTKARFEMGLINQIHLGNYTEAITCYTNAINTNNSKNFAEIYLNRGQCYLNKKSWDNAIRDFTESKRYASNFTGTSGQKKQKTHDLYYSLADAWVRKTILENNEEQQSNYAIRAISAIRDYIDKFEGFDRDKTALMKSHERSIKQYNN